MKTTRNKFKEYSDKELAESFVFPSYQTEEQRQDDSIVIQKLREESSKNRTEETTMMLQLLHLKYKIEDYIKKNYI